MPIHHTPDHPDSFGLDYTGTACREEHARSTAPPGGAGATPAPGAPAPATSPRAPAAATTAPFRGEDVLLFVDLLVQGRFPPRPPPPAGARQPVRLPLPRARRTPGLTGTASASRPVLFLSRRSERTAGG